MTRANDGVFIDGIALDPSNATAMHRQLYEHLREMVLSGVLSGGTRMPSSRALSNQLGVSRFTVVTALEQLIAEGYLRSVHGSGTYVETIPDVQNLRAAGATKQSSQPRDDNCLKLISTRVKHLTWRDSLVFNRNSKYLHMSAPDHRHFPAKIWSKMTEEVYSTDAATIACYRDQDEPSLLERQIASQVAVSRGILCDPAEVVTTFGAHHAVSLLTELLLDPGDCVAFEEPGMSAVRSIFQSHGCIVHPMPVDESGADPSILPRQNIKLAFVTAAKQQPLTIPMPAKRKLAILNWAADTGSIIVEDDLGSEFRYQGRPIPPLKAMDDEGQVIYVGAFSMTMLQTLRIGYMIMPRKLASLCRRLIQVRYRAMPQLTEQTLARFIEDGHFTRHLHKMRRIYAKRQEVLLEILHHKFQDVFEPAEFSAGFYSLCYFKDQSINEDAVLARCNDNGLGVEQLSYYYQRQNAPKKALLIGFASSTEDEIKTGTEILRTCVTNI